MLPELLHRVSLFRILHHIDQDLARACKQVGCPFCRGPLHAASYLRKPRGSPADIPEEYQMRLSLCCGSKNCRRRVLPPSCLFMGRKVYWGAVILIVVTLRQTRPNGFGANRLMRMFDIPRKTIVRWIRYFQQEFPRSPQWQQLRGLVRPSVGGVLPGNLVEHFLNHSPTPSAGLVACLRFLASGQTG